MKATPKKQKDSTGLLQSLFALTKFPFLLLIKQGSETLWNSLTEDMRCQGENTLLRKRFPLCTVKQGLCLNHNCPTSLTLLVQQNLWTSRTVDSYMAVTIQFISDTWEMQSWCLGCAAMHSDHTGENIRKVLEETVT